MKKILFVTIGSRDVTIDKPIFEQIIGESSAANAYEQKPGRAPVFLARTGGKFLLDNWDQVQSHLSFPILKPFLEHVLRKVTEFDQVYLVATDQSSDLVGNYAKQDTVYFAEIIAKHLKNKTVQGNINPFRRVNIIPIKENVIYLDAMFNFFKERFGEPYFQGIEEADQIHLCNQGGIDAINTGLMLQLLYKYGSRVSLYNINEQTQVCTPLEFQSQFGYEQEKARFRQAIQRHDYAAAKSLNIPEPVKTWCAYAESRLNFDFDAAQRYLEQIGGDYRARRDFEILDIQATRQEEEKLTAELYWNAIIRYQQEAFVDFIQRFFRIVEQIAQYEVQKLIDFRFDHRTWKRDFVDTFLEKPENSEMKAYLEACVVDGSPLNFCTANIRVFQAILQYGNPDMSEFIRFLRPLAQLRNQGIGAHGFSPIGKEQILSKMNTDAEGLEGILSQVEDLIVTGANPYVRIQSAILSFI